MPPLEQSTVKDAFIEKCGVSKKKFITKRLCTSKLGWDDLKTKAGTYS